MERPIERPSERDADRESDSCAVCGTTADLDAYAVEPAGPDDDGEPARITLCDTHARFAEAHGSNAETAERGDVNQLSHQETQKITARVPKPLLEALDEIAGQRGQTRSEIIRDFFEQNIRAVEAEAELDDLLYRLAELQARNRELERKLDEREAASDAADGAEDAADVEFLKRRIERLESLLEQTIEKV